MSFSNSKKARMKNDHNYGTNKRIYFTEMVEQNAPNISP